MTISNSDVTDLYIKFQSQLSNPALSNAEYISISEAAEAISDAALQQALQNFSLSTAKFNVLSAKLNQAKNNLSDPSLKKQTKNFLKEVKDDHVQAATVTVIDTDSTPATAPEIKSSTEKETETTSSTTAKKAFTSAATPAEAITTSASMINDTTLPAKIGMLSLGVNEEFRDSILLAEQRTNIDGAALAALIDAEAAKLSNRKWNKNSEARSSSAAGLTQFLNSTWLQMARKPSTLLNETAKILGYVSAKNTTPSSTKRKLLNLRFDPTQAIVAAAEYGNMNLAGLKKAKLIPKDISDKKKAQFMYLAHHEGLGGAKAFLNDTLSNNRAKKLLSANVTRSSKRNALISEHGSPNKAYKAWLNGYIENKIQPERFRAVTIADDGSEVETDSSILIKPAPTTSTQIITSEGIQIPNTGDENADIVRFFKQLNLKNFKPYEFLVMGSSNSNPDSPAYGLNKLPPRELWKNIAPTAKVLDILRDRLDSAIFTLSAYRSPAYNTAIGGAKHSLHKKFSAVDIVVTGTTSRPMDWAEAAKSMRSQGIFSGGIGIYKGFIHIDTRGTNADWSG